MDRLFSYYKISFSEDTIFINVRYRKQQKLNERKVLQFTGFHSNIEKTFAGLASFAKESYCSKVSSGKPLRLVGNP